MSVVLSTGTLPKAITWFSSAYTGALRCSEDILSTNTSAGTFKCVGDITHNAGHQPQQRVGWMPSTPFRGTAFLLWFNLFVIFLCTWTGTRPRVLKPAKFWYTHKYYQVAKNVLCPGASVFEAIHEYWQARNLISKTKGATNGQMKLVTAFYLGMLGVRYRTGENSNRVLWPKQYAFMLNKGIVAWGDRSSWGLNAAAINDKSDSAGMGQAFTLCNILWALWIAAHRLGNRLPLTPLEITTIAYAFCAIVKCPFWWHKPKDVLTYSLIDLPEMKPEDRETFESLVVEDTYDIDGPEQWSSRDAYSLLGFARAQTPVHTRETPGPLEDEHAAPDSVVDTNVKPVDSLDSVGETNPSNTRSIEQTHVKPPIIILKWDSDLYRFWRWRLPICALMTIFSAVHLGVWNYAFPTTAERWLWQSCAILSTVSAFVSTLFREIALRWTGPMSILRVGFFYLHFMCRIILAALVFASLRSMPVEVYHVHAAW